MAVGNSTAIGAALWEVKSKMQEVNNVGIYCRLSRDDERSGESVSIENQKELLGRHAREQGWTIIDYYVDDGVSGTTFDRPGFNRLVQDARDGKINIALCKDLSRLGRDYLEAGKYTSIVFPSLGCRFIALNDGVDTTRQNDEMVMILKNVMNDLYARDTSSKIKAVKRSSFKAGKYVGCYAPIGYQKSPDDKHVLVPDPATAPIVKRIFDLRCQGFSYRKIATTLNTEGIPTPSSFYYLRQGKPNIRKEGGYWQGQTVKAILQNEVYLGHMVQNKTGMVSYKIHKQVGKPQSEWIRVEDTHEPLISQEVWDLVRTIEQGQRRNRTAKDGTVHLFSGVLFCMDCGATMRHHGNYHKCKDGTPVKSTYESYLCNRYCASGRGTCTAHTMNQRVLVQVVLADIRTKAALAQNDPSGLVGQIQTQRRAASAEQMKQTRLTLTAIEKRLTELGKLVQAIYEDKVMGRVPEAICIQLMNQYEAERAEKLEQKGRLSGELEAYQQDTDDVQQWMNLIREYAKLEQLDRPTLLRLVKRIDIGEKKVEGGRTVRDIKIHYNFVGYIED